MKIDTSSATIAFYLRDPRNLHYFAALKPYLDHFMVQNSNPLAIVVQKLANTELDEAYTGYTHLFTENCDLDSYDLVLTPSFLRSHERGAQTRAIQIFHGLSDKPFTYERDFSDYVLCLCAGQRQVDRFRRFEHNREMKVAIIGYPKFDFPPTMSPLFNNDKKTIIYCPTWRKGGISSIELFLDNPDIIAQLTTHFNVIVKPHPNIFNPNRDYYSQAIVDALKQLPGIYLVSAGNVMPYFAQSDLFIGDISAAGYEWLYFDRPMVFLNPQPDQLSVSEDSRSLTYLWQCGDVCNEIKCLFGLVMRNLQHSRNYHRERESILHYSVYQPRDHGATKRGLACIERILQEGVGSHA